MKLENQCVSLELAKKLKELGVKQESLFVHRLWYENDETDRTVGTKYYLVERVCELMSLEDVPAYTVAELGEMLPKDGLSQSFTMTACWKGTDSWECGVYSLSDGEPIEIGSRTISFSADTEADARAKCLIYLIENGLIEGYGKKEVSV